MGIKVETPPHLSGKTEQQVKQLYGYLYRLSENLNIALNNLDGESFFGNVTANAKENAKDISSPREDNTAGTYNELRALIVNTANIVQSEMDILESELHSEYSALSEEWGTYRENITTIIESTAHSVVQTYHYDSQLEALREEAAGFSAYQIATEGYIKQGFIDYDENNVPILGIAIGQGLTSTTVTINGEEYEQIDNSQSCAFYTANKVSFRINGQEVAYVSNRKLYIGDAEITGTMVIGSKWLMDATNGLTFKWIGG